MQSRIFSALLVAALVMLAAGCAHKQAAAPMPEDYTLAVAGFTQPTYTWELLAGSLPEQQHMAEPGTLADLDRILAAKMLMSRDRAFLGPSATRQCQEIATFANKATRGASLKYWTEVGSCIETDYLLVPQLLDWIERKGNERSVRQPASVTLDFYVLDVKKGELAARFRFDEMQLSLADNLLDFSKFFDRGGRWLTAQELATEGIAMGLKDLGL